MPYKLKFGANNGKGLLNHSAATIPQYKYCILYHNILQYIRLLLFLFNMGKGGGEKEVGREKER